MKLKIQQLMSQRDSRWGNILLGYNTNSTYNISNYGCLITSLGMYINNQPNNINELLRASGGFTAGSGNFIWSKSTVLGLNQTYVSPVYNEAVSSQGINKMKELLDGGYPLLTRIDFNPSTASEEMHFVLVIGYEGDEFFIADPWVGQIISLDTYGGAPRAVIQFRAYDKKLPLDNEVDCQEELDKCRVDRDKNWNYLIEIAGLLNKETNITIIKEEIEKLIKLEDKVAEKDRQLRESNKKIAEQDIQIKELGEQFSVLNDQYQQSKVDFEDKSEEFLIQIKQANETIEQLKKDSEISNMDWWDLIKRGIEKLIRG